MRIGSAALPDVYLFVRIRQFQQHSTMPAECGFGAEGGASLAIDDNGDGTVSIRVLGIAPGGPAYLGYEGTGFRNSSSSGGGTAYFQQSKVMIGQKFRLEQQSDGTTAIASVNYPGVYLRMDGSGLSASNPGPGGVVNGQYGVGALEKFLLLGDAGIKSNWSTRLDKIRPAFAACLANGQMWVSTDDGLQGFAQLTGAPTYRITFGSRPTLPRSVAPRDDGLLVFCNDHELYQVSLDPARRAQPTRLNGGRPPGGWDTPWFRRFGASVYIGEAMTGIVRTPPQQDFDQAGFAAWPPLYGPKINVGIPSFVNDGPNGTMLAPTLNKTIDAVDAMAMTKLWSVPLPGRPSSAPTACNGECLCVVIEEKSLCGISLRDRREIWKLQFDSAVIGGPVCNASYCYVALASGAVLAISVARGEVVARWPLTLVSGSDLLTENGVLYASVSRKEKSLFGITANQVKSLFYEEVSRPRRAYPIGVENGVLYAADDKNVFAVRPSTVLGRFYAEINPDAGL